VRAGDTFLGLDLVTHGVHLHQAVFEAWRAQGVTVQFVVYDLLPVQHPEWFPAEDGGHFREWLRTVFQVADSLVCISAATADAVREWLPTLAGARAVQPVVRWFHLGADLPASLPSAGLTPAEQAWLERPMPERALLTVGTVEPRKGIATALAALEQLWARGDDVHWWIVGRAGWMVEALVERLRAHPEAGRRLHWFESASDELLQRLYRGASVLLMASEGEGFGLPLIEAAQYRLPLLVRDLPVFREVAGTHAAYFSGDHDTLAQAISEWFRQRRHGRVPDSAELPWLDWSQSCAQLLGVVLEGVDVEQQGAPE
jgi:glycosyltransferase involved in cell wall biosynthesis